MKVLCFTLSISIVLLSTVPCCSDDDCIDEKTTTAQTESHNDHCSNCSPFLPCGSCYGFVFTSSELTFKVAKAEIDRNTVTFMIFFVESSIAKIWQPPKIG